MPELTEVVGHLNISDETKTKIEAGEVTDLKAIIEEHNSATFETRLEAKKNDPEFIKPFKDQGYKEAEGKLKGTWENQLPQYFPEVAVKDDKGMRPVKDILGDIKTIMESTAKPDDKLKEMQTKLLQANNSREELAEQIEAGTHPTILALTTELNEIKAEVERERRIAGLKAVMPQALTIPVDDAAYLLSRKLEQRSLKLSKGENGNFEIKTADGLWPVNSSGTKTIKDARELVAGLMTEYIQRSNGKPEKPTQPVDPSKPEIKFKNPRQAKIQAQLDEQRKRFKIGEQT